MGARDTGWIQIYAENNQEAYDNFIMAMPIGETLSVRLPVMTCMDGFITSHAVENIDLLDTAAVRSFIGEYTPENYLLKKENPLAVGPYDISPYYMEHKVMEANAMKAAKTRILEVASDFEKLSGRSYGFFEAYRMEDAELAVVLIGSSAGTAKAAVDGLRQKGVKAGLIKVRVFRPFPGEELALALANTKAVAIMDKSEGFSANGGPLFAETRSALYDLPQRPHLINIVYGLGGRDVKTGDIEKVFGRLAEIAATGVTGPVYTHMGQRQRSTT
jgi:pyruvate ferredoxin oxidoreductase alpha subunit